MSSEEQHFLVSVTDRTTSFTQTMQTTEEHLNHHLSGDCAICKNLELVHLGNTLLTGEPGTAIIRDRTCGIFSYQKETDITDSKFCTQSVMLSGTDDSVCYCGNHQMCNLMVITKDAVYKVPGFLCNLYRTKKKLRRIRSTPRLIYHKNNKDFLLCRGFSDMYPNQKDTDLFVPSWLHNVLTTSSRDEWQHPLIPPGFVPYIPVENMKINEAMAHENANFLSKNDGYLRSRTYVLEQELIKLLNTERNLSDEARKSIKRVVKPSRLAKFGYLDIITDNTESISAVEEERSSGISSAACVEETDKIELAAVHENSVENVSDHGDKATDTATDTNLNNQKCTGSVPISIDKMAEIENQKVQENDIQYVSEAVVEKPKENEWITVGKSSKKRVTKTVTGSMTFNKSKPSNDVTYTPKEKEPMSTGCFKESVCGTSREDSENDAEKPKRNRSVTVDKSSQKCASANETPITKPVSDIKVDKKKCNKSKPSKDVTETQKKKEAMSTGLPANTENDDKDKTPKNSEEIVEEPERNTVNKPSKNCVSDATKIEIAKPISDSKCDEQNSTGSESKSSKKVTDTQKTKEPVSTSVCGTSQEDNKNDKKEEIAETSKTMAEEPKKDKCKDEKPKTSGTTMEEPKRLGWMPVGKWTPPTMVAELVRETVEPPVPRNRPNGKFRKLNSDEAMAFTNFNNSH